LCHFDAGWIGHAKARDLYTDSFIPPDRPEIAHTHDTLARVRGAMAYAIQAGAKMVSLNRQYVDPWFHRARYLEAVRAPASEHPESMLLVVGATGDVDSDCARCLAPKVTRVLLNARNGERLRALACELEAAKVGADRVQVEIATDLERFSPEADIVISAASLASPSLLLGHTARPEQSFAMRATRRNSPAALTCLAPKSSSGGWDRSLAD
jgi:hypothetical protein